MTREEAKQRVEAHESDEEEGVVDGLLAVVTTFIEQCAQEVEKVEYAIKPGVRDDIAARIRALKGKKSR